MKFDYLINRSLVLVIWGQVSGGRHGVKLFPGLVVKDGDDYFLQRGEGKKSPEIPGCRSRPLGGLPRRSQGRHGPLRLSAFPDHRGRAGQGGRPGGVRARLIHRLARLPRPALAPLIQQLIPWHPRSVPKATVLAKYRIGDILKNQSLEITGTLSSDRRIAIRKNP